VEKCNRTFITLKNKTRKMKRILFISALLIFAASCGTSNKTSKNKEADKKETPKQEKKTVKEDLEEM
jgi:hypothetical protein